MSWVTFRQGRVHSSERHVATCQVWWGSAIKGILGDGWCIFLIAYLHVWVMPPPLREIQLELEISSQCWLSAHSHRPGSVSSTSESVWAQEEKVRGKQTAEGLESWDSHRNGVRETVRENSQAVCKFFDLCWWFNAKCNYDIRQRRFSFLPRGKKGLFLTGKKKDAFGSTALASM